jgi:hypothetical protein
MTPGQPPTYSTLDTDLLLMFQSRMLEPRSAPGTPITIPSGIWSVATLASYLQYRTSRFLRETGLLVARLGFDGVGQDHSQSLEPTEEAVALPQNLIDVLRLAFVSYDTAVPPNVTQVNDVPRADFTSLDSTGEDWEQDSLPQPTGYTQSITQTLQAFLAHPPSDVSAVDLTFVAISQALQGTGQNMNLPPEFCYGPLWGMMADAYSDPGEAQNFEMAAFCEARYDHYVLLARSLLCAPSIADLQGTE